jgi:cysteine desulfurase
MTMKSHKQTSEIYLDANATTPVLPEAAEAVKNAMNNLYGNPSSSHITGLRAKHLLETTRLLAQQAIQAASGELIFTSGATEGIHTAIFSALTHLKNQSNGKAPSLLYGSTEHKAVPETLHHWNKALGLNAEIIAIPVDEKGLIDLEFLAKHIDQAGLVCTMAVNNETGAIQDLEAIKNTLRENDGDTLWLVDSVQALGKVPLNLEELTVDYSCFSGHKLYCPKGIGMLYIREDAPFTPLIVGGGQEHGFRSGTENIPGIAALGEVLKLITEKNSRFRNDEELKSFQEKLVSTLKAGFPDIIFNTPFDNAVATTINFSVKGFPSKEIMDLFDAAQIRVSSGSACSSKAKSSFVLDAMGIPKWQSESAIRLSFGPATTAQEIDEACSRIKLASKALEKSCLLVNTSSDEFKDNEVSGLIQIKTADTCTWIYASKESKKCIVIDPVASICDRIQHFVECQGYDVLAILDTHSHADHELCRDLLHDLLGDHIQHEKSATDSLGWPKKYNEELTLANGAQVQTLPIDEGFALLNFATPGHTKDSRTFLIANYSKQKTVNKADIEFAFTGDTILIGGLGRTDFAISDPKAMYNTLFQLGDVLAPTTLLCSSHDYENLFATTWQTEIDGIPLLGQLYTTPALSLNSFLEEKIKLDKEIEDISSDGIVCGAYLPENIDDGTVHVKPKQIKELLNTCSDCHFFDVREPHEYHLFQDWQSLGFKTNPENIPLSRFVQFIHDLKAKTKPDANIIFVCRSGNRSYQAALVLRRLGYQNAKHVSGGMALSIDG